MTTSDEPLDEKDCLEFINMFNSMISTCKKMKATCKKMKATIKRIQGSSNKSPFEVKTIKTRNVKREPSETSTCLTN